MLGIVEREGHRLVDRYGAGVRGGVGLFLPGVHGKGFGAIRHWFSSWTGKILLAFVV